MAATGSLIPLHGHENMELLNDLSVRNNVLYFRDEMVCEEYESRSIKIMIDDVWDAMKELESAGGESDDTEQSEGSSDTE